MLRAPSRFARSAPLLVAILISSALVLGTGRSAQARCGEFGGLGVFLVTSSAAGTALLGGLLAPGIISLTDESKEYPYPRNALFSVLAGGGLTAIYAFTDLATDCSITNALDDASLVVIPAITLSGSVLTALLLWAYADEREPPPPVVLWASPRAGGGTLQVGLQF